MFQSLNLIVAATVLLSNGLASFASPARRQVPPVGNLHPVANSHGKCVDVRGNSHDNGTPVQMSVLSLRNMLTSLSDTIVIASIAMVVPLKFGRFNPVQPRSS